MDERANFSLAQRAWDAVARADADALRAILDDRVVWHATGANPWRGRHEGFDAVLDYLARVGELTETFDARLDDVLTSDDRVLLVFHVDVERAERKQGVDYLCLARIRAGRAVEVWTSPLDPDAIARFWAV